ncbi:hypothetical protein EKO27_g6414 [Xylaria grammica]|uniref:Fork-head domain-containing protein n=1 Tax=Xylaria grammica TaxID=363999 RepID=A0A439D2L8_9PEZI|nr:hypothetical protein EKO27_g6414 [Xylaria grammica]
MRQVSYGGQPTSYPAEFTSAQDSLPTTSASRQVFLTPPPTIAEETDGLFSTHSHYTTAPSSASPVSWPPAIQMDPPQFSWDAPSSSYEMGTYAPSFGDHLPRRVLDSPSEGIENEMEDPFQFGDERGPPRDTAEPAEQSSEEEPKAGEPYARLIYKAFMSRKPAYAMTLQEIYQWFREHTDKADNHSKGWQNSIRHNLSMNAAFVKRDSKPNGQEIPSTQDAKKSTEWVLENWAATRIDVLGRYMDAVDEPSSYNRLSPYTYGHYGIAPNAPNQTDWTGRPIYSAGSMPHTGYETGAYGYSDLWSNQPPMASQPDIPRAAYQTATSTSGAYGVPQERLETENLFGWNPSPSEHNSYYSAA